MAEAIAAVKRCSRDGSSAMASVPSRSTGSYVTAEDLVRAAALAQGPDDQGGGLRAGHMGFIDNEHLERAYDAEQAAKPQTGFLDDEPRGYEFGNFVDTDEPQSQTVKLGFVDEGV